MRSFWSLLINTTSVCPIIHPRAQKWATAFGHNSNWHLAISWHSYFYYMDCSIEAARLCRCVGRSASLFFISIIRFYHDSAGYYVSGYHIMYCRSNNINNAERQDPSTDFPQKRKHQNVYKIFFAQVPQIPFNPNSTPYITSIELPLFAHGVAKTKHPKNWHVLGSSSIVSCIF